MSAVRPSIWAALVFLGSLGASATADLLGSWIEGDALREPAPAHDVGEIMVAAILAVVVWRILIRGRAVEAQAQVALALASVASEQHEALQRQDRVVAARARIEACIRDVDLDIVFQPIVGTRDGAVIGVEALSRFRGGDRRPDEWFADAALAGMSIELEMLAIRLAVTVADQALLLGDVYLAVNVSPVTATSSELAEVAMTMRTPLVLELTEHEQVTDYDALVDALRPLRAAGVRIAADDTGAGYSGLTRLVRLSPDCIKLDRSLIHGIDEDPAKRAMASAVSDFAAEIGAFVVAEGVENESELQVLTGVGVRFVQGYHLAAPAPMPEVLPRFHDLRAATVLVVDDDAFVRSVLRLALDKGGFHVVGEAGDGATAVRMAQTTRPDVVVLDLDMPQMSGEEALPRLRELRRDIVVVLLTSDPSTALIDQVEGFVDKATAVTEIAELIQGILDGRPHSPHRKAPRDRG